MSILLLTTKLYPARARADRVTRPRLTARLDSSLDRGRKLTLICAPAGAGKTTLLADWLTTRTEDRGLRAEAAALSPQSSALSTRVAWVSLDADDNDPMRFWNYVIAALATVHPGLDVPAQTLLATPPPPIQAVLTLVINAIADRAPRDHPLVLILDDYHVIDTPAIHEALLFLIDHLPPQLHLVLTSRADPPLPLARLRTRGELAELRATDLRFTPDEAATFLNATMGLSLSAADIATLEASTEGWIAGLHLAALALRDHADPGALVTAFARSTRFVVDYLMEEVFRRQPPHIQTFLLQTSILDQLCGPLCDAVLGLTEDERPKARDEHPKPLVFGPSSFGGDSYSQLILHQLEQSNLFIVPLDTERQCYRYHHLFAEVLRERLRGGARQDAIATLHRRAAAWFAQQGQISEAVQHALAARHWEHAADLILAASAALLGHGRTATILRWLEALPPDEIRARPRLCLLYAWALIGSSANPAAVVEPWVQAILQRDSAADPLPDELLGEAFAIKATIASMQEDIAPTIELAQAALAHLPLHSHWQSQIRLSLGIAYTVAGEISAATLALTEAAALSRQHRADHLGLIAESFLAHLLALQGHLSQAMVGYHAVLQQAADRPFPQRGVAFAHGGLGNVLRERNQLDAALTHLQAGADLYRAIGGAVRRGLANAIPLARIKQAQGDWAGADAVLAELHDLAQQAGMRQMVGQITAWRARVWLAQGQLAVAGQWADTSGLQADDLELPFPREVEYLTLARVRIAQGRDAPGEPGLRSILELLDRLLVAAEAVGRMGSAIEILSVRALALDAQGDRAHALSTLERALAPGEEERYVRMFVDEGAAMAALLADIAASDAPVAPYAATLLDAFPDVELRAPSGHLDFGLKEPLPTANPKSKIQNLVEPLSDRELQVLRLIAAGHSNQEIAASLIIVVGTVKKHINSIFGKLQVRNRTQALIRARDLGLL
jgi:LuxR family maltose regulon positive regulatory protein